MFRFKVLAGVLAGGVVAALLASCAGIREQVKAPEVSVGEAKVVSMSLTGAQVSVDLVVKNPNAFGVSAESLSYVMRIQDKPLFEGKAGERLRVEPGKSSRVTLPFTFRYDDVLGSVAALRESRELRYRLNGKIDFGLVTLPYAREGRISLPRLPEISVQSLQISQLNLSGVELALKMKVNNPNGFAVRIDQLDYDVKLAGIPLLDGRSAQPIAVKAHKEGLASLKVNVGYGQVSAVMDKVRNAKSLPIEFTGRAKVPGLGEGRTLPYSWVGEVPLVRK